MNLRRTNQFSKETHDILTAMKRKHEKKSATVTTQSSSMFSEMDTDVFSMDKGY